jgi:tetratricopeptide (TPR) repeat protein
MSRAIRHRFFRAACVLAAASAALLGASRDSAACLWDDESYAAEEHALPCFTRVLTDTFVQHSAVYFETRLRAAESALAVDPWNPWALDMASTSLLKLKRFPEAEAKMQARLEAFPDAYASHANLGTLYTFTGQFDKALIHIDKALLIEPTAHFGREKYHRLLVVFLQAQKADPASVVGKNFLNISMTAADCTGGSPAKFDATMQPAGLGRDVFDALDSMISIYGASDSPYVYAAAGDMMTLFGNEMYATMAYTTAAAKAKKPPPGGKRWSCGGLPVPPFKEIGPSGMPRQAPAEHAFSEAHPELNPPNVSVRAKYKEYETKQIVAGLAVWTTAGITKLYQDQSNFSARCPVGKLFPELETAPELPAEKSTLPR